MKYKELEIKRHQENVLLPRLLRVSYVSDDRSTPDSPLHSHNFIELLFISHGQCRFTINGNFYHIKQGDLLIIPAHSMHTEMLDESKASVGFYTASLDGVTLNVDESSFLLDFSQDFKHILTCFESIYKELELGHEYSELSAQRYADILFVTILRRLNKANGDPMKSPKTGSILQTKEYVDKYFYKEITVSMLADIACVTVPHYIRSFKKMTGLSPLQYLNNRRITEAVASLTYTNKSISSIAMDVGYSSINNFISKFKELYGVTPQKYRKQIQSRSE